VREFPGKTPEDVCLPADLQNLEYSARPAESKKRERDMKHRKLLVTGLGILTALGCQSLDQRSYRLGSIGAFSEMVEYGVKRLALSAALPTAEMDAMVGEAQRIAGEHGAEIWRETDFLVTDLFSSELTDGLEVLLIFRGDTKDVYLALKAEKARLEEAGEYHGDARRNIAMDFGRLLSYPDAAIEGLIREQTSGS
jgi:hypothetical protein